MKINLDKSNRKSGNGFISDIRVDYRQNKYILFMAIPVFLWYFIFCYIPMIGVSIGFMDYNIVKGLFGSHWVGLKHFKDFLTGFYAFRLIRNTLLLSFYQLIFGFPAPIILAILLNEVKSKKFGSVVQTFTYLPHFISLVVVCGMITSFTAINGPISSIIEHFGGDRVNLLMQSEYFRTIYISTGVWQNIGWSSIIYLAALSGIDTELYEASTVDGAGRFKQFLHITLPGIAPTIVIMLIMQMGRIMTQGSEKVILLYNPATYETADIISSYVYRKGIVESNYSFSTAVGLFNSVINLVLMITANAVSKKVNETSMW